MRILIFTWKDLAHPAAGGAEVFTHEVARHWVAEGHYVVLLTSWAPGLSEESECDGVRIVRRGGKHSVYKEARRFYIEEGRGKFDLVIDQINTRPFSCPRFVTDAPVIAIAFQAAREVWFYETPLPIALVGRYLLEPWWLRRYRNVLTVTLSSSSKRSLENYGLRRVVVIPPGFTSSAPGRRSPVRETSPTIIYVGRLTKSKRPHHVLRAFAKVRRVLPDAQLWMVGTGGKSKELRRKAPPGVIFFGRIDESVKEDLLAKAHVHVMASVREGWGLAVTEAASVGTPTVAYAVDGLRDSVPVSGGILTAPKPKALAGTILNLVQRGVSELEVRPAGVLPWNEVASSLLDLAEAAVDQQRRSGQCDLRGLPLSS